MKRIVRDKQFLKHYKLRIAGNPKLVKHFAERIRLFMSGERGQPINDHPLRGEKLTLRAFSVTGDVRVVYRETQDAYIFLDVGTHNQVY